MTKLFNIELYHLCLVFSTGYLMGIQVQVSKAYSRTIEDKYVDDLSLEILDQTLDKYEAKGKKIKKIRIGYKLYAKFMADQKFADEVINSALDPDKRSYRGVRVKITHDDEELTFLMKN